MWDKVSITTKHGDVTGIAPLIISASRSTDIPAFCMEWFMDRLGSGYLKWVNPFNGKEQYVSLESTKIVVFWSKDPRPLFEYLDEIEKKGIRFYVQYTLNDYGQEGYEPGLPSLEKRIGTFRYLSDRIGREKVIWRFDPLFLTDRVSVADLAERIERVGSRIHPYTEKLVFSFADIGNYRKVSSSLKRQGIRYREFDIPRMEEMAGAIAKLCRRWGIEAATCGEKLDLEGFGIAHNKCIDDELILRIAPDDAELRAFIGSRKGRRDRGQRAECRCIPSKDIGSYDTCRHLCVYCYANTSEEAVMKNAARIKTGSESLIG